MAGDWIKFGHALPDKPEVQLMASILSMDSDAIVGKLCRLWIWADQQSVDGNAMRVTETFLDRITNCPGFAIAMRKVDWLEGRDLALSLPRFDRHNGQTSKTRALTKDRVEKNRNVDTVTESLPEKRREEKSIKTPIPPDPEGDRFKLTLGAIFRRKPATPWDGSERKRLEDLRKRPEFESELGEIVRYYGTSCDYLRRDLVTLLNNWQGELDRARNPNPSHARNGQTGTSPKSSPGINSIAQADSVVKEAYEAIKAIRADPKSQVTKNDQYGIPRPFMTDEAKAEIQKIESRIKEMRHIKLQQ